ncbi:hypothetical protein, conserved [Babesia bigemina]|uniref:Uncharacterized protein n=1 Tax=Babesia bigemina TaxID=5866 RepID=A0A061DCE8_BABBI|nr:hypothetical protein, conserved [Babesia bigemina]CDR96669.1 hypothetical protein, conserved [Babesia bigemina]|eukprot:XP_012768855.1 hypothetical protein, conserved [Babesia bigemina]
MSRTSLCKLHLIPSHAWLPLSRHVCLRTVGSRAASTTGRVFRTCLPGDAGTRPGWVPLSSLYGEHAEAADSAEPADTTSYDAEKGTKHGSPTINTPNQVLFVARKGLRCQVFDTKLWQDLYQRTVELSDHFQPRQWVELVHIFKRIKVRQGGLLNLATRQLLYHLERLSLEDLSKLALSFAYYQYRHTAMFDRIADVVTTRLRREKLQEGHVAATAPSDALGQDTDEPVKNRALSKITSYTHLVGAFARCDHAHKELFEAVAADLVTQVESKEMMIPPGFLVKIIASYARFGYRHSKLLDTLSKEMVTAKIPDEQLLQVQHMMKALEYENDAMLNLFAYRLGNSEVAGKQKA